MENELVENSNGTRKVLLDRGIIPEKLEVQEDIKKIEKRRYLNEAKKDLKSQKNFKK